MSRISTGTGDDGTTGVVGGARVPKTGPRIAAVGAVDEANDAVGVALSHVGDARARGVLETVQRGLFRVGADLAAPAGSKGAMRVRPEDVAAVTSETDRLEAELPPLRHFILPGGAPAAAFLFLARGLVRRAERAAWALDGAEGASREAIVYLNRLSDLLFLMARTENVRAGVVEPGWLGKDEK